MTQKSFREATCLKKIWNKIVTWNGYTLATVLWHDNPWKIIDADAIFEDISERSYTPIREFRTQRDLWEYLKTQA